MRVTPLNAEQKGLSCQLPLQILTPMSDRKLNIAIVGLGFGAEFIPIYQRHPNANMYAICQRTRQKLDAIGEAFGVEQRYTDFNALLKDRSVDLVHINSPIPDHGWQSIA